jgi:hypothetical protein
VNFGGRPPAYFGSNESNPSLLKLWITSRTRSSDVDAIRAIAGTSIACADHNKICARRQRTTDPEPRLAIPTNLFPSSRIRSRTCTRSAISQVCATTTTKWWTRPTTLPVTALVRNGHQWAARVLRVVDNTWRPATGEQSEKDSATARSPTANTTCLPTRATPRHAIDAKPYLVLPPMP